MQDESTATATSGAYRNTSLPFEFTGNAKEYFSIWIVNILLTILTLGIYSAWAKVRNTQYFYGNTHLDGHTFRYTADPKQILKGRVIAVVLFAAYYFSGLLSPIAAGITIMLLMLLVPAFVVMSMSFQLRNSAYRNIRFNFDKNFRRSYYIFSLPVIVIGLYFVAITLANPQTGGELATQQVNVTLAIVAAVCGLMMFLLYPWWEYMLVNFKVTHADFGTADFGFAADKKDYYKLYMKFILISIVIGIVIGILSIPVGMLTNTLLGADESSNSSPMPVFALTMIPFIFFYLWIFAYLQTKRTNLIYNNLSVDGHTTSSELETGKMFMLYLTNTIAILVSLGLLTPWAKVRTARYRASRTSLQPAGDFNSFIAHQEQQRSAFGEEMGEVFDMDLGM